MDPCESDAQSYARRRRPLKCIFSLNASRSKSRPGWRALSLHSPRLRELDRKWPSALPAAQRARPRRTCIEFQRPLCVSAGRRAPSAESTKELLSIDIFGRRYILQQQRNFIPFPPRSRRATPHTEPTDRQTVVTLSPRFTTFQ